MAQSSAKHRFQADTHIIQGEGHDGYTDNTLANEAMDPVTQARVELSDVESRLLPPVPVMPGGVAALRSIGLCGEASIS